MADMVFNLAKKLNKNYNSLSAQEKRARADQGAREKYNAAEKDPDFFLKNPHLSKADYFNEAKAPRDTPSNEEIQKKKRMLGLSKATAVTGNQGIIGSMLNIGGSKLLGN